MLTRITSRLAAVTGIKDGADRFSYYLDYRYINNGFIFFIVIVSKILSTIFSSSFFILWNL